MMGGKTPKTYWAVNKRQDNKLKKWLHQVGDFIHLAVCLTTDLKPLPKQALHIVRSRASSFKWEYPLLSLRSSNSFLRLLPCLPVTSIPPCIFPSVTRYRRQFLRKMRPIHFAFRLRIYVGYSSALWLYISSFLTSLVCEVVYIEYIRFIYIYMYIYIYLNFYGGVIVENLKIVIMI